MKDVIKNSPINTKHLLMNMKKSMKKLKRFCDMQMMVSGKGDNSRHQKKTNKRTHVMCCMCSSMNYYVVRTT